MPDQFDQEALDFKRKLQAIEDELVDKGYDEIVVATKHGSFWWCTTARAKVEEDAEAAEEVRAALPGPPVQQAS